MLNFTDPTSCGIPKVARPLVAPNLIPFKRKVKENKIIPYFFNFLSEVLKLIGAYYKKKCWKVTKHSGFWSNINCVYFFKRNRMRPTKIHLNILFLLYIFLFVFLKLISEMLPFLFICLDHSFDLLFLKSVVEILHYQTQNSQYSFSFYLFRIYV